MLWYTYINGKVTLKGRRKMPKKKMSCNICGCQHICIIKRQIYDTIIEYDYLFIEEDDEPNDEVLDVIFEIIAKSCSCFVQEKEED